MFRQLRAGLSELTDFLDGNMGSPERLCPQRNVLAGRDGRHDKSCHRVHQHHDRQKEKGRCGEGGQKQELDQADDEQDQGEGVAEQGLVAGPRRTDQFEEQADQADQQDKVTEGDGQRRAGRQHGEVEKRVGGRVKGRAKKGRRDDGDQGQDVVKAHGNGQAGERHFHARAPVRVSGDVHTDAIWAITGVSAQCRKIYHRTAAG